MRIISGKFKGQKIKTLKSVAYRPTQSRIRKSLFDILGSLHDKTFLDLFAGSGIIGFEAASRGAENVVFVENRFKIVHLLKENAAKLEADSFTIVKKDVMKYLPDSPVVDIVYADPPYSSTKMDSLVKFGIERVAPNGWFILETQLRSDLPPNGITRKYGDTQLTFWNQ